MPPLKSLPPEILSIIQTYVWWKTPEEALQFPRHILAQAMNWATWEDAMKLLDVFGPAFFVDALKNAPPGVIEPKSWAFWHHWFGFEVPPLPKRVLK